MQERTCACEHCDCKIDLKSVIRDGKHYCCKACADHHSKGQPCEGHSNCHCGDGAASATPG